MSSNKTNSDDLIFKNLFYGSFWVLIFAPLIVALMQYFFVGYIVDFNDPDSWEDIVKTYNFPIELTKILGGITAMLGLLYRSRQTSTQILKSQQQLDLSIRAEEIKRDEFQLELVKSGFEDVFDTLKDKNNSRVKWIKAAKILLHTLEIEKHIKTDIGIKDYKFYKERLRIQLYEALQLETSPGVFQSLPAQFFYGVENWQDADLTLEQAAIQAHPVSDVQCEDINKILPDPIVTALLPESVTTIFDFLEGYDPEMNELLSEVEYRDGDYMSAHGFKQGPAKYIHHRRKFKVLNGEIHVRDNNN
ncbi:hypothetical protein [Pseudoalteromonas piratica]|uniref:Uncharacterized protein n=1 Tax=Pseudoalteromonas piratica TaxID=1348114 RepID=A0A0A7EF17_9GAMM|nr:hypothetical protein [Pseudoalteromonas piratica]AIY65219.1 hypothetical protein OM33_08630 [Pseudoalteromonas piratica]